MKEVELLKKSMVEIEEVIAIEIEKANFVLTDYYSVWYEKNDNLDYEFKGHLMPRIKITKDTTTGEAKRVEIFWNYSGARRKTQHKYSAMKYIKKGKGSRYSDHTLSENTDQAWELSLAKEAEDKLELIRKRITSLYRIKKSTKASINIYTGVTK